ncbi:Uncharacterised protein [Enterobacter cloacae]|nr:Uncharacterised protein [Enterobacter cloacae]
MLAAVCDALLTAAKSPTSIAALLLSPASALFCASQPSSPSHDQVRARRVNISAVLFRSEICASAEIALPTSLSSAAVIESITATRPLLAPVAWFTESIIDRNEFVSAVLACESVRGSFSNSALIDPVCFWIAFSASSAVSFPSSIIWRSSPTPTPIPVAICRTNSGICSSMELNSSALTIPDEID